MTSVLNFSSSLLDLGRSHLENHRAASGLRVLQKLSSMSNVDPDVAAEANFLIGRAHFERADYEAAEDALIVALDHNVNHADANYLLARTMEKQSGNPDELVARQYREASALKPDDIVRKTAYARVLVATERSERGLKMLRDAYRRHKDDPMVVEQVLEGLVAGRHYVDAVRILESAFRRRKDDPRFRRLCCEFNRRRLKEKWPMNRPAARNAAYVVPFPAGHASSSEHPVRKMAARGLRLVAPAESSAPRIRLNSEMPLSEMLDRLTSDMRQRIAERLGCALRGKQIDSATLVAKLSDGVFVRKFVRNLPPASAKLLKTLVGVGGAAPLAILSQYDVAGEGMRAAQPLLEAGLAFAGTDESAPPKRPAELIVVPMEIVSALSSSRTKVRVRR